MSSQIASPSVIEPQIEVNEDGISSEASQEDDGKIRKLSEFMTLVESLPSEFSLSRGQTGDYSLLPSALRKDSREIRKFTRQSAAHFLNQFKINSHYYMESPWDVKNDYEWMVHAQHYGIPTRLLDFTHSHIISLLFAVEDAFSEQVPRDAVVWFLNPKRLNFLHSQSTEMIILSTEREIRLDEYNGPVIVQGRKLNTRINAQNGVFLYFQDTELPLEQNRRGGEFLKKAVVSGEHKKDILSSLYAMGIGFTQIYPELPSVSKDILMRESISQHISYGQEGDGE